MRMLRKRTTLRLRVMAGVAAITLVALAAFDIAAVTVMRGYLVSTTRANLRQVLTVTEPRLSFLLADAVARNQRTGQIIPVMGAYSVVYQTSNGQNVVLQDGSGVSSASWKQITPWPGAARARAGVPITSTKTLPAAATLAVAVPTSGGVLVAGASLDQVNRTVRQVILIVTLGSVAAVLLIGLGAFIVLRRGMRPIESMAEQADRITAGDLADRVDARHPRSEVGRLGTALNGMLDRIESTVAEREADQESMRQFFADASHELRTPLASLRANAELYQQGALPSKGQVDEVMRRITLETHRMSTLVDDMLRLARLGQHPGQPAPAPVDLTAVAEGCVERARIASPGRVWRAVVSDDLTVLGDEELLCRAIDNLLANVRVHTPADVVGTITVAGDDGTVSIEVADDGPGVPFDELPRIFDRFYRGASPVRRPGSGLGLAIVSGIAAAHGGMVRAAAGRPHGLRVTLTLPALTLPALTTRPEPATRRTEPGVADTVRPVSPSLRLYLTGGGSCPCERRSAPCETDVHARGQALGGPRRPG
jgi:two-component system OmpR family sensor kinase